jgi:hypothetical protein
LHVKQSNGVQREIDLEESLKGEYPGQGAGPFSYQDHLLLINTEGQGYQRPFYGIFFNTVEGEAESWKRNINAGCPDGLKPINRGFKLRVVDTSNITGALGDLENKTAEFIISNGMYIGERYLNPAPLNAADASTQMCVPHAIMLSDAVRSTIGNRTPGHTVYAFHLYVGKHNILPGLQEHNYGDKADLLHIMNPTFFID